MARRPSISDWLNSVTPAQDRAPRGHKDTVTDAPGQTRYLLEALRSQAPGQWSQNVLALANHYTSSAYLAINGLANQAASAEKRIYDRTPDPNDADVELPHHDPLCRLFEDPNDDDSFGDLMFQGVQQISLTGTALIWKPQETEWDIPSELYVLPTASALPWPPSPIYPHGSYLVQPYYPYGPFSTVPSYQSAAGARIPAEQVMRVKNHHPILKYDGYAVLTAMSRQVDTIESIDLARWNTQQRGVDPTLALNFDPELYNPDNTDFVRLRAQLEALYSGPNGAGKIMFNPLGSTVTRVSNTPAEMAWQDGWRQLVEFVLAAFGVPMSVAGMMEATSYATLYAALKQFYLLTLNPLLRKFSDRFTKSLIRPYYGKDLYMTLKGQKISDDDLLEKQLANDDKIGLRTRNERRMLRELPPVKGPKGDELIGQVPDPTDETVKPQHSDSPDTQDPNVERSRPVNAAGEGSRGPRKRFEPGRLAAVFEREKTRGTIRPAERNGTH